MHTLKRHFSKLELHWTTSHGLLNGNITGYFQIGITSGYFQIGMPDTMRQTPVGGLVWMKRLVSVQKIHSTGLPAKFISFCHVVLLVSQPGIRGLGSHKYYQSPLQVLPVV